MKLKKQISLANFNGNGGFVVGTQTFFVGIREVSIFRGIYKELSALRLRKELINHNLYLFAWPFKVNYGRL